MQLTIVTALVAIMLFGLNAWQWRRNGALSEQKDAVEQELVDARKSAERLAEASKEHQRTVDRLSRDARKAATVVASVQDDCLDRELAPPVLDALRMFNATKGDEAAIASTGKRKKHP